jgi:hypothetical protein
MGKNFALEFFLSFCSLLNNFYSMELHQTSQIESEGMGLVSRETIVSLDMQQSLYTHIGQLNLLQQLCLQICQWYNQPGSQTVYSNEQVSAYTFYGDQWVGYDTPASLQTKVL